MIGWLLFGALGGLGVGLLLGYRRGHRDGSALCPTDHTVRDIARQRDRMMRERDEANAAANHFAMALRFLQTAQTKEERPN